MRVRKPSRVRSPEPTATLFEQARAWFSLWLAGPKDSCRPTGGRRTKRRVLSDRHNQLEKQSDAGTQADRSTADQIAGLRRLSEQRKTLAELDQRIQDCQQLAGVYQGWSGLIEARRRSVLHLLLGSLAEILAILLAAMLAIIAVRRMFHKEGGKRLQPGVEPRALAGGAGQRHRVEEAARLRADPREPLVRAWSARPAARARGRARRTPRASPAPPRAAGRARSGR